MIDTMDSPAEGYGPTMDSPGAVMGRLLEIERDLANRQNLFEEAAGAWYTAQRDIKRAAAMALLSSTKVSITEKKAEADLAALSCAGVEHEALYEALKAVIRVLEQRAMIGMAVLKSQGRAMSA